MYAQYSKSLRSFHIRRSRAARSKAPTRLDRTRGSVRATTAVAASCTRPPRRTALPRDDPETEVRLPQRVVDRERALEDRLRSIEGRRLPREGSLAGALEVMLECRLAQTESKSATVTKDLTTPLVRDQQVELAE